VSKAHTSSLGKKYRVKIMVRYRERHIAALSAWGYGWHLLGALHYHMGIRDRKQETHTQKLKWIMGVIRSST
jgi:hypothetical protein